MLSFFTSLQRVLWVLVHVKDLESQKGQIPHQKKLLSPTEKTRLLKLFINNPRFNSLTS